MADPKMNTMGERFRGFLPVIIDVESSGTDPQNHALLELAAISTQMDEHGFIYPDKIYHYHINAFEGSHTDPEAMAFHKIDPTHPFRFAVDESEALKDLFGHIKKECKKKKCTRAVLVGHNAWFDQHFMNAAARRADIKSPPFHRFTSIDTASLSAMMLGQTVLSKALKAAGLAFNQDEAHSAIYDAERTTALFCRLVNRWKLLGGQDLIV